MPEAGQGGFPAEAAGFSSQLSCVAFTPGWNTPSSRFRVRQYIPALAGMGVRLTERAAAFGSVRAHRYWPLPLWAVANVVDRLIDMADQRRFHGAVIQREFVSTLYTTERFIRIPAVLDVDDAVWVKRKSDAIFRIAQRCRAVICGNEYIEEEFGRRGFKTYRLPTAIDVERFSPGMRDGNVLVWTGTAGNLESLYAIEGALRQAFVVHPTLRLRVVCDAAPRMSTLPAERLEYVPWSPDTEVETLRTGGIGLMPLDDNPFARGKCSYKALLCMSCALPVVISPVGMNRTLAEESAGVLLARTDDEWTAALLDLARDPDQARRMGLMNRRTVEQRYALAVLAQRFAAVLRQEFC